MVKIIILILLQVGCCLSSDLLDVEKGRSKKRPRSEVADEEESLVNLEELLKIVRSGEKKGQIRTLLALAGEEWKAKNSREIANAGARSWDVGVVEVLIDEGVDFHKFDETDPSLPTGFEALFKGGYCKVLGQRDDCLEMLRQKGFFNFSEQSPRDLSSVDWLKGKGYNLDDLSRPLFPANSEFKRYEDKDFRSQEVGTLKQIIKMFNKDKSASYEYLPNLGKSKLLMYVLENQSKWPLEFLKLLLHRGMDPNQDVGGGENGLIHLASQENFRSEMADLFVGANVNIDHKDVGGRTALFAASWRGSQTALNYVLSQNPDLNIVDQVGRTALWIALERDHKECAETLIKMGANPILAKKCGTSPLLLAVKKGYTDIARMILEKGANKDQVNTRGESPISVANTTGNKEMLDLLKVRSQ